MLQQTYKMGWLSVELLLNAINGESIPRNIDTGIVIVDKNNLDNYSQEMKTDFKTKKYLPTPITINSNCFLFIFYFFSIN